MDLHAHSGKNNFVDIFSLSSIYLMICLPSSKKHIKFCKTCFPVHNMFWQTCAPIYDPIEEWVVGVMVVDVASGCLWSRSPWSAIRRRQSGLAGRQQARRGAGQANQGTGRGPSVTGWLAGREWTCKKDGRVTMLCCTSYKPKYSNVQGVDLLKKVGVTLMISSIQRITTGSGLKREICLALNQIFTSLKSLLQNFQSFKDNRPCPTDGIFEVLICEGTILLEPSIGKNLPSPSIKFD